MKKILVIGNPESIFVKDFCTQISNNECVVDVLSIGATFQIECVRKNYSTKQLTKDLPGRFGRIISTQLKIANLVNKLDSDYDCIIIHFVDFRLSLSIRKLLKKTKRLITVVWGSDFYRTTKIRNFFQKIIYKKSSAIVFTNPATIKDFENSESNISGIPLMVARFGLPALDEIKKIREMQISRVHLCEFFGLLPEKTIILAGYNANPAHQQELIIKEFAKLDKKLRSQASLVFPLGYGDSETSNKLKLLLENNKIENYKILDKFYNFQDIAKLRCITDVLINIQPTDQFSGSMQETIFAGGRIISGEWLPYAEITKNGAPIKSIKSLQDIGMAIKSEIETGQKQDIFGPLQACSYIEDSSSWGTNLRIWKNIMFNDSAYSAT